MSTTIPILPLSSSPLSIARVTVLSMIFVGSVGACSDGNGNTGTSVTATAVAKLVVTVTGSRRHEVNYPCGFSDLAAPPGPTPDEMVAATSLVFTGRVISTELGKTRFEIKDDFKRSPSREINITYLVDPGPCSNTPKFTKGQQYLIFANLPRPDSRGQIEAQLQLYTSLPDGTDLLVAANEYRVARRRLEAAAAAHPHDASPLLELARFLEANRETVPALERYTEAIPFDPSIEALSGAAQRSLCDRHFDKAYEFASRALSRSPNSEEAKQLHDLSAVAAGQDLDLRHADLSLRVECDWPDPDRGITLDLSGRDASGLRAKGARLHLENAAAAHLVKADLEQADLSGSLRNADLGEANLRGATISGDVSGANFSRAEASRVGFVWKFDGRGTNFSDATLDHARLIDGSFADADFTNADLTSAELQGHDFVRARFVKAKLTGADMERGDYAMADFTGANLVGARFGGSNFRGAKLENVQFDAAQFSDVAYDCMTRWPSGFDPKSAGAILVPGAAICPRPAHWDYSGRDLSAFSFTGADLTGADFRRSIICDTRFAAATLNQAKFEEAHGCFDSEVYLWLFSGARLDRADLRNVHLSIIIPREENNFLPPDMKGADLRGAQISVGSTPPTPALVARLQEADLRGAMIDCFNWSDSAASLKSAGLPVLFNRDCKDRVPPPSSLTGTDLVGTAFKNFDLRGMDLTGADFHAADLKESDLRGAKLRGLDLHKAELTSADLRKADLRDADLAQANLEYADLRGADLRNVDLSEAKLKQADLRDADLRGAKLTQLVTTVKWGAGTRWPNGFVLPGSCAAVAVAEPAPQLELLTPSTFDGPPGYPPISRRLDEEGSVLVSAKVSPDGRVIDECPNAWTYSRLRDAALDLVTNQLRFAPFASAEPVWTEIEVDYVLE